MSDIICVTNRKLCKDDFLKRLQKIARAQPKAIILREKDLTEDEYFTVAKEALEICEEFAVPLIAHSFLSSAQSLRIKAVHLPLNILKSMTQDERKAFSVIGASCHSVEDAKEAQSLGCTYITAGHIFETDCKRGLAPRGIDFLKEVCGSVSIPVFAIGGITSENYPCVLKAGAKGACAMSGFMMCDDPGKYINGFCI